MTDYQKQRCPETYRRLKLAAMRAGEGYDSTQRWQPRGSRLQATKGGVR